LPGGESEEKFSQKLKGRVLPQKERVQKVVFKKKGVSPRRGERKKISRITTQTGDEGGGEERSKKKGPYPEKRRERLARP